MSSVFLDTVGLIAVWDEADQWHPRAEPVFMKLLFAGRKLMTTPAVLLECGNAAARRNYRRDVCDLRNNLLRSNGLIFPTDDDVRQAWEDYRLGQAGDAGIVDHLTFVVMRRLGITEAFTNDQHFAAAGFTVLF
ncbi:MAG: hypothetical protein WD030_08290 [Pirellulales bacterium]